MSIRREGLEFVAEKVKRENPGLPKAEVLARTKTEWHRAHDRSYQ